jgi:hypothetical protein
VNAINPDTRFFAYRDSMACDDHDASAMPDANCVARLAKGGTGHVDVTYSIPLVFLHTKYNEERLSRLRDSTTHGQARWNVSRGLPAGSLNLDNQQLFLLNAGNARIQLGYKDTYLMDFGSGGWRDYFIRATVADKIGRPWSTQGQYVDDAASTPGKGSCPGVNCVVKFSTPASWGPAMNGFLTAVADAFAEHGVPTLANRGRTKAAAGVAAWVALDRSVGAGHAPVGQMEESAFITHGPSADVNWVPHEGWVSQISVMGQVKNSIVMMSTNKCQLVSQRTALRNVSGTDNYGNEVHFWQVLWYAMASFHVGKNDVDSPFMRWPSGFGHGFGSPGLSDGIYFSQLGSSEPQQLRPPRPQPPHRPDPRGLPIPRRGTAWRRPPAPRGWRRTQAAWTHTITSNNRRSASIYTDFKQMLEEQQPYITPTSRSRKAPRQKSRSAALFMIGVVASFLLVEFCFSQIPSS